MQAVREMSELEDMKHARARMQADELVCLGREAEERAKLEGRPLICDIVVPPAPRPEWLPKVGLGLANVDPVCWALSVEQWVLFVEACRATETWTALAKTKWEKALEMNPQKGGKEELASHPGYTAVIADMGETVITMYDVKDHFVVPWTQGTGNSVALLMNRKPQKAKLMVSHAWGGSVIESRDAFKMGSYGMVGERIPPETYMFFCTLSMYQPEDGAHGGLSIAEQLRKKPFAAIIESRPPLGMRVLHTSLFEVYSRLWTVHEVDEGILAGITMTGLFDLRRFLSDVDIYGSELEYHDAGVLCWKPPADSTKKKDFQVDTCKASCRAEDLEMLQQLIIHRGGFERLDGVIAKFRENMMQQALRSYDVVNTTCSAVVPDWQWDLVLAAVDARNESNWEIRLPALQNLLLECSQKPAEV